MIVFNLSSFYFSEFLKKIKVQMLTFSYIKQLKKKIIPRN